MPKAKSTALLPPIVNRFLGWGSFYLLLIIGCFNFPLMPSAELDPSWRMALGYFFEHNMQFGHDVVFTYGPLGFIMGKTFSGIQFWSLIAGQLTLAVISATVILKQGLRITGYNRVLYIVFILLFGILYEDALHMIVLTILGFELLRLQEAPRYGYIALIGAVLAFYSQIKFTDLLLAVFIVVLAFGYGLWKRKWGAAMSLGGSFLIVYLGIWMSCGQNLTNLPAYLYASWDISQGYQWAMGFPTPSTMLWKGLVVLGGLIAYAFLHLRLHPYKPRAIANVLLLGAFIYLNWKHGFVRADGHMIGFFFCALLPLTAYPALLDDTDRMSKLHRWGFILLFGMCVWALDAVKLNVVSHSFANLQNKIWANVTSLSNWQNMRDGYRDQLGLARKGTDMPQTRKMVGKSTVDVLGSQQGVALFNRFNYRPRPSIQGYSTFTPILAELNGDFYASEDAPEYVLMKIQSIDNRLPAMDDSQVLRLLPHRYNYSHTENGFVIWKRKNGEFTVEEVRPRLLKKAAFSVNESIGLEDLNGQPLWVSIDLQPNLWGKVRSFFYKPPQVTLGITNTDDNSTEYLMPLPQGRTGFIINPIVEDYVDYLRFASNTGDKLIKSITVTVAEEYLGFFFETADIEISALPPSSSAGDFFPPSTADIFPMFQSYPLIYESYTPLMTVKIADRDFAILHAPSRMVFDLPNGAKQLTGDFGMLETAYTGNNHSNGTHFVIYWSDGSRRIDLYQRFLSPEEVIYDRGIQDFSVKLTHLQGGRIFFEILPGPNNNFSWDWAGWSNIKISR